MPPDTTPEPRASVLREPIERFVKHARSVFSTRLRGITLFGPALDDAPLGGRFQINTVLVLDEIDLELLRRLAAPGPEFRQAGFAAPLIMTPEYIRASLDSFPLELIEIAQHRQTLWGTDHFAGLAFADADVRLECERELKTVLIAMHQGLLTNGPGQLAHIQRQAAVTVLRVLRGVLWLAGRREAYSDAALIAESQQLRGQRLTNLSRILGSTDRLDWPVFRGLYDEVTALRRSVDAA